MGWQGRSFTVNVPFQLSEELLYWFNADLIFLEPLAPDEIKHRLVGIHRDLELPPLASQRLEALSRQAVESGRQMRWLEAYASRLARRHLVVES